ncbi:MAG: hypothetical protein ACXAEU_03360 [Candidatus Hodarchaeales archaeon]|jgi:hypothetical protein
MTELTIRGLEISGKHINMQFDAGDETIIISDNRLSYLDLTPLSACKQLQSFSITHTKIRRLDLTPLIGCEQLQKVILHHNGLNGINLLPLASCPLLELLDLRFNPLEEIDISPFVNSGHLRELLVDGGVTLFISENLLSKQLPIALANVKLRIKTKKDPLKELASFSRGLFDQVVPPALKSIIDPSTRSNLNKERLQLLRKITGRTLFTEIDNLVPVLKFRNRVELMRWLYGLPDKWLFTVEGSTIRFGLSINDDIDLLLQQYESWEQGGKVE